MRSSVVRVWLINRFQAGAFERSVVSQKVGRVVMYVPTWRIFRGNSTLPLLLTLR